MKDLNDYRLIKLEDEMSDLKGLVKDVAFIKANIMIWNMIAFLALGSVLTIAARTYIFTP